MNGLEFGISGGVLGAGLTAFVMYTRLVRRYSRLEKDVESNVGKILDLEENGSVPVQTFIARAEERWIAQETAERQRSDRIDELRKAIEDLTGVLRCLPCPDHGERIARIEARVNGMT